jgi:dTDP-4-amino-4,6-dideoxygalactose transaminase
VANAYDRMLRQIDGVVAPVSTPGSDPVYHLYVCQLDIRRMNCTRDEFCAALKAEGVPTAVHYPRSLPQQPALAKWNKNDNPVADSLSQRVFALPMHHDLSDDQIRIVGESVHKVAEAYRN